MHNVQKLVSLHRNKDNIEEILVGDVVGTVSVKAQEVLLFWDVVFFRAR
jgi:hypothetical protein